MYCKMVIWEKKLIDQEDYNKYFAQRIWKKQKIILPPGNACGTFMSYPALLSFDNFCTAVQIH